MGISEVDGSCQQSGKCFQSVSLNMLMNGSIAGWVQGAAVVLVTIMRAAAETASGTLIRASLVERRSAQEKDLLKCKTKKIN